MKALISYTSSYHGDERIRVDDINTIDDLLNLMKKEGNELIISDKDKWCEPNIDFQIEVYDGYRE